MTACFRPTDECKASPMHRYLDQNDYEKVREATGFDEKDPVELIYRLGSCLADPAFCQAHEIDQSIVDILKIDCIDKLKQMGPGPGTRYHQLLKIFYPPTKEPMSYPAPRKPSDVRVRDKSCFQPTEECWNSPMKRYLMIRDYNKIREVTGIDEDDPVELVYRLGTCLVEPRFCLVNEIKPDIAELIRMECVRTLNFMENPGPRYQHLYDIVYPPNNQEKPSDVRVRDKSCFQPTEECWSSPMKRYLLLGDYNKIREVTGIDEDDPVELVYRLGTCLADPVFCQVHDIKPDIAELIRMECVRALNFMENPGPRYQDLVDIACPLVYVENQLIHK